MIMLQCRADEAGVQPIQLEDCVAKVCLRLENKSISVDPSTVHKKGKRFNENLEETLS